MGLKLTTDRHPQIKSQTPYPLHHLIFVVVAVAFFSNGTIILTKTNLSVAETWDKKC